MLTASEASIEQRLIKVVIWSKNEKKNKPYLIDKNTTIQNIIDGIFTADELKLADVCMALLGHIEHPFQLLPSDFPQQLTQDESDSRASPPTHSTDCTACLYKTGSRVSEGDCTATDFSVKVFNLIMATPDNIMGMEDFISSCVQPALTGLSLEPARMLAVQKAKEMFWDVEDFENYSIHLFLYNHQENDLCNVEGSEDGKWSKKDWKLTTNESSLWLQLEKDFLTTKMNRDLYDWTEATI